MRSEGHKDKLHRPSGTVTEVAWLLPGRSQTRLRSSSSVTSQSHIYGPHSV